MNRFLSHDLANEPPEQIFAACFLSEKFVARIARSRRAERQFLVERQLFLAVRNSIMELAYWNNLERLGHTMELEDLKPNGLDDIVKRLTQMGMTAFSILRGTVPQSLEDCRPSICLLFRRLPLEDEQAGEMLHRAFSGFLHEWENADTSLYHGARELVHVTKRAISSLAAQLPSERAAAIFTADLL